MSTECLYIFVNQDPITDPYGWIQNLCARTGYELGPVGSSYWLIRLDSIYEQLEAGLLKQYAENNYFSLVLIQDNKENLELIVHRNYVVVYDEQVIEFSNRWDTFLQIPLCRSKVMILKKLSIYVR